MMTPTGRESAKIIPFRSKARAAAGGLRTSAGAVVDLRPQPTFAYCDFGSGSYHDAAIQEELRDRKG